MQIDTEHISATTIQIRWTMPSGKIRREQFCGRNSDEAERLTRERVKELGGRNNVNS